MKINMSIPKKSKDPKVVLETLKSLRSDDYQWKSGRVFGLTYGTESAHHQFIKSAYGEFISENFLNPMAFKSLKKMEYEVVRMSINLLNGDEGCVGTMTSGGTESLLMAVKAAREYARKHKPWIRKPELICSEATHVAVEKACYYFGVKYVPVKVDKNFKIDLKQLKKKMNRNTIMMIGSAPQYPQGVIDPIEEMGEIAIKKKVLFHVDACIGGFMLPWIEKLGEKLPPFDFRVKGVTSISADLHKYGFTAKGASVVMYRDMKYMKHQFFVSTGWTGGIYASPNMPGTRPGGAIACAWAVLNKLGQEGYLAEMKKTLALAKKWRAKINSYDELEVLGEPKGTIFSFATKDRSLSTLAIADQMTSKGWYFDRQQNPESIHLTIMPNQEKAFNAFFKDLSEAIEVVKSDPELASSGSAAMYGMMSKVPMRGLVKDSVMGVMESLWGNRGIDPEIEKIAQEDDSLTGKLMNKYGKEVLQILDKTQEIKEKILKNFHI